MKVGKQFLGLNDSQSSMRRKAGFSQSRLSVPSVKGEFYADLDFLPCPRRSSECHGSSLSAHLSTENDLILLR